MPGDPAQVKELDSAGWDGLLRSLSPDELASAERAAGCCAGLRFHVAGPESEAEAGS